MDLFFEIQRDKVHIFLDAKETSTILDLKKVIQGILKVEPSRQELRKEAGGKGEAGWEKLSEASTLAEAGFTTANAKAQGPAALLLVLAKEGGGWEEPKQAPLSTPPPLPDVMRSQDSAPTPSMEKGEQTMS